MRKPDPGQPVPAVHARNDFEAQVIAGALNRAGIRAVVAGSHGEAWAGPGNFLAPVTVLVRRAERPEALRLLRRLRAEAEGRTIDDAAPMRAIDDAGRCVVCRYDMTGLDENICPECGTDLTHDDAFAHAAADISILRSAAIRVVAVAAVLLALIIGIIMGVNHFM